MANVKPKVVKTRNAGTMTEAQYFQKIRSSLRNAFRWWLPMKQVLENAKRHSQSANKKLKWEYKCNKCKRWFPRKEVEVDHVIPCGTLRKLDDIPGFIQRLTAENPTSYQVLCKKCHKLKTQAELTSRKKHGN
jgi:5-methylcytosine-specific restriction endonuclease McrA